MPYALTDKYYDIALGALHGLGLDEIEMDLTVTLISNYVYGAVFARTYRQIAPNPLWRGGAGRSSNPLRMHKRRKRRPAS